MFLATYDPIEYWVLIPKLFEILLFIVIAININSMKDYILNKLLFIAFILWAIYIILNSIIYLIAANNQLSFDIATILHRIGIFIAIITALFIFTAALVVKEGKRAFSLHYFQICVIIGISMAIIDLFTQEISIVDRNGTELLTETEWNSATMVRVAIPITWLTGLIATIPMIFFFLAILYLLNMIKTEVSDEHLKQQMILLVIGISLLCIGMIYFVIIQRFNLVNLFTATLGHLIWSFSPIFIWKSNHTPKNT